MVAEEVVEETVLNTGFRALAESLSGHLETRVFLVERGKSTRAKIRKNLTVVGGYSITDWSCLGLPCQDLVLALTG